MKLPIITFAAAIALAAPSFADGHAPSVAELLAMSNNSAAEIMLNDSSMGDVDAAQMRFALGNMSAAEREAFFSSDTVSRKQILAAQMKLMESDSAAEMNN
ncbi:hypothetical protein [Litoreibacter arenae]|uniref:DUF4168 domain-containing protein n=1 Tax=Litoreibacter arenae DSM 19593 TaxID=1123360 RepID=S9QH92_9RHOB|nr:hypothetical protein [Litoreibacter arenae]EPX78958.1 hypothetical protein thalar_01774 [Litoreibacter arenae DSM 19593]